MKFSSFATTAVVAAIAGFAGSQLSNFSPTPAEAQVQGFGHIQVESLTLVGNGRVRGGLHIDHANRAVFQLRDPTGSFNGISIFVGDNGSLQLLDVNNKPLQIGAGEQRNLPPLQLETASDGSTGKGDSASLSNVNNMRDELNALWRNMRQLKDRVNVLSN